jgi:tRNA threonylcarbamoyladenosine biosynthesis protein TsaB
MMDKLLLMVDTATSAGSVALCHGSILLGEFSLNVRTTHTDRLLLLIRQLLDATGEPLERLDAFGVVLGPGAFTGLRVGVATVKGLALALRKPVVGVSSLQALAMQVPFAAWPVCALLDARKSEVYAGLYDWDGGKLRALRDEAVLAPAQLLDFLPPEVIFVGDGALAYRDLIQERFAGKAHFAPWPLHLPKASSAAPLALASLLDKRMISLECLVPTYIRPSEAELSWRAKAE